MSKLSHVQLDGHCYHTISATSKRKPIFADPRAATILLETIQFIRQQKAYVLAFAIMPDHLHLLLVPKEPFSLAQVMQSVKGYSSRTVNRAMGAAEPVWQQEYYDRLIRDDEHLEITVEYIHRNPVEAGLATRDAEYRFSSAWDSSETDLETFFAG